MPNLDDWCHPCGASIPPKDGEGTCQRCEALVCMQCHRVFQFRLHLVTYLEFWKEQEKRYDD